jgi:uncharacterized protein (TIGR02391 family)
MDNSEIIRLLEKQIEEIQELRILPPDDPQYKIWDDRTERILENYLPENYLKLFRSCNRIGNPFAPKRVHSSLHLKVISDKETMLKGFISDLNRDSAIPGPQIEKSINFENYDLHPEIKRVSQGLFEKKEYAPAVLEAFKCVINRVKEISGLKDEKNDEGLMGKVFTPEGPIIKLNNLSSVSEKDEHRGFMNIFKGIVGLRNLKAHENVILNDPFKAIEYLSLASLLCRVLDERVK